MPDKWAQKPDIQYIVSSAQIVTSSVFIQRFGLFFVTVQAGAYKRKYVNVLDGLCSVN